jgi:LysR family glycine cleavage system transcriptional activator
MFEAAARYGSASLAATRIGLTQSAVSRHIASLETWLGKALFDRVGRRIVLNEQGGSTSTASPGPWVRSGGDTRHAGAWGGAGGQSGDVADLRNALIAPRLPGLLMHDPRWW